MSKEVKDFVMKMTFNPETEILEIKLKIRIQTFFLS